MKNKHERYFTLIEHLKALYYGAKSFWILQFVRRNKLFHKQFKERIMLKITEINGCSLCSYVHTKIALQSGMSNKEIKELLAGELKGVPEEQQVGVVFGMHYTDSKEQPDIDAVNRVISEYNKKTYLIILAIARMITFTNSVGISFANMKERVLFQKARLLRLFPDLFVIITTFLLFPIILLLHGISFIVSPIKQQIVKES